MRIFRALLSLLSLATLLGCPALSGQGQAPGRAPDEPVPVTPATTSSKAPATAPMLRLETGMHTALIRHIGVDAAQRFLVTGSYDKTVRVWELATGRLLRTLRLPIDAGDEGKVYSVALSSDGRTVAAAGWTGEAWDGTASIYLFERDSGRLRRRLSGLPQVIYHLVYSRDGAFLVATLGGKHGMRLYRTSDNTQVASDTDYGDSSHSADFDRAGRLVTTSWDGFVRLYDPSGRLVHKRKAPGGVRPFAVAFSPDGTRLAVGYDDSTRVDVLAGTDLAPLYAPDTTGVGNGNLGSVTWSADGRWLYAGGQYSAQGAFPIRRWADGGRGAGQDLAAAQNTIFHLLPLDQGSVVFGAYDPAFGVLDAAGQRRLFQGPGSADFRGLLDSFRLSRDGTSVQFGYEPFGASPARFALRERRLSLAPAADPALSAPQTTAQGLNITDWKDTTKPTLNGTPLALESYETSRSLAIAPDGQRFLLGTEWTLRLFNRQGQAQWQVPVPSVAWSVNIAGNGQVAVAALGDGSIRWYRMDNGKELLAFFPHKDQKRWVLWTPSGYYDTSPGAEDLIGWHVNRGRDQEADFFPVGQFRNTFYRPDVVAQVLESLDEAEALRLANAEANRRQETVSLQQQLPPVVQILTPQDNTTFSTPQLTVRFRLRSSSGEPVTAVKALVDGRPAGPPRRLDLTAPRESEQTLDVPIPPRDVEVSILAENRYAVSAPATIRLRWQGAAPAQEAFVAKPKLYVLAVGVSQYQQPSLRLDFPAKDAQDVSAALRHQQGKLYRDVEVRLLTDAQANRDAVLDGLEWLQRQTTSKDVAALFVAGHGVNDPNGHYYFLPANVDPERLKSTGVAFSEFKNTVAALAGKVLFFLDTCHAGNVMGEAKRRAALDIAGVINELASAENGAVVFAASTGNQVSLEHPSWGNGAFTKALVEGFAGKADYSKKGRITVNMLDLYLSERVKELTGGRQTPTTTKPPSTPDFPVALVP